MGRLLAPKPVRVSQGTAPLCWAAATTSWLTVNKERPQLNLKQLVDRYGDPKKNGGISFQDAKYEQLRKDMRWTNTNAAEIVLREDPKKRRQLTLDDFSDEIEKTLFDRGYLLLVDNHTPGGLLTQGISHMYVVFGVKALSGGGHELFVMDPASARGTVSVAEFLNHHVVMLGTLEKLDGDRLRRITATNPDET